MRCNRPVPLPLRLRVSVLSLLLLATAEDEAMLAALLEGALVMGGADIPSSVAALEELGTSDDPRRTGLSKLYAEGVKEDW